MTHTSFAPRCLCLDIETAIDNVLDIYKFAAWRADTDASVALQGKQISSSLEKIDALTEGAAFVLGHNVVRHDLPALAVRFPSLRLNHLPAVDTLELSPIAFPANPYHSLVKDYKLVRDARNDPLKDAQLSLKLWQDQYAAFEHLNQTSPDELACHHYFLTREAKGGVGSFFAKLRGAMPPKASDVKDAVVRLTQGKVCPKNLNQILLRSLEDTEAGHAFSYVLAWLRVSGGNSVLPPWVRLQYPSTTTFIEQLRETPCDDPVCPYCSLYLDPRNELDRYFGFSNFRPEPKNAEGGSLQEDIVRAGYAGESILAILPTGGGKSICYQLPALSRHWRNGSLTIIVSPLQSLMKDQVDNLVKVGIYSAATLNGMLTMPERREVLEKIRLGDVGILLVSPEQFRNHAFVEAIRHRQIGTWVFDEAHCLSKWGNDFRPDYLYVSRFIRERYARQSHDVAPVSCYTATAKREVIDDIRSHFQESLGIELRILDGGHERNNLHYEVMPVTKPEKPALIHRLLEKEFGDPAKTGREGGAVVFAARRKSAEELSGFLKDMGWACAHFHAGLDAGVKKDVQQAFIEGDLKVIVATNAFGMGVDKPDVRIVIHAEIPGSLENYLQEAGRAGRDREESRCVLLYDEEDVEAQFSLSARSRLSRQDIAGILKALRRYAGKTKSTEVVVTPGEILADDDLETSIEADNPDADTKVRTAVSWLERARFLERNENHTRVFPGSLKVPNLEEAEKRLRRANLSEDIFGKYRDLVSVLINARDDEGISTDELMAILGATSDEVIRMLHQLEQLGVLTNDLSLTVLLRKGVKDASQDRLLRLIAIEKAILELLPELAPDADSGEWQDVNQRGLCQELKNRTGIDFIPADLMKVLHSLARPFGEGEKSRRASIDVKLIRREILKIRLLRSWANIREIAEKRRSVAGVLLQFLLRKLDDKVRGVDLRVECKVGELAEALKSDLEIGPQVKDDLTAIDAGLLYLHDNGVVILDRGKTVFRSAMTIEIFSEERRGFTNADYEPLKEHYNEKNFQIHVIHEYAKLGLKKLSDALNFVLAYFTLPKLEFIRRYFAGRKEILDRATTEESYRRIVESLRHPIQQRLVSEKADTNRLILAGPGSGKTRVIVHRVAYLVRVLREPPSSIIVLAFNRGAAWEIRQRLRNLIASDAGAVTVLTYHALAFRLTGTSFANLAEQATSDAPSISLDGVLDKAIALLQGKTDLNGIEGDSDELRERLLAGYRHILVDEYQDIDQRQYELISALAGRQAADKDARLTLLAVGDDDQNIYTFRGTSNEFIHRFQEDYQAKVEYLVENYRSNANIIAAANALIASHPNRLKVDHPIRINHARQSESPGGLWQRLDPIAQGRTQILSVPGDHVGQAVVVIEELMRLKALDANSDWGDFAVLARNRATLDPFRAWCHQNKIGYRVSDKESAGPRFYQTREAYLLLDMLRSKPSRRLKPRGLLRWFEMRFGGQYHDNPWLNLLGQFVEEFVCIWGEISVPSSTVADELYEFGVDAVRTDRGRLTLSTVHSAKGREFKHVVILDGQDWTSSNDDERRLYYVGMTRAKENLVLCQSAIGSNPFSKRINGDGMIRIPIPETVNRLDSLALKYLALGLADIDLGYAGRMGDQHPIHRVLDGLEYGEELQIFQTEKRIEIRVPSSRLPIGALAKRFKVPEGRLVDVRLDTLVRRSKKQSAPPYAEMMRVENWYVPLVTLTVMPAETPGIKVCQESAVQQVEAEN
ncbi:RecQ family ATP-dependent DNA helicase [Dechloromonas sp. TW-R-39-2]|uniref:RecQ family ATP-dependent DNA helicase n=1 Tax=Dechloromonas sp. TW-R-39-2 TaxID=2654218 RepID=UPI00193D2F8B|nr:RecQ family ATP-dependent DNA helicase [Dechloromonas sp. TW-R-39-2]QRM18998.1 RecQ family ATP-dependent DNA helicase [Dechloromonas sp. TW-R-39-2]